ncbi:MAG: hypothetical protein E7218_00845 [Anaerofustis stercorihominis]|nr:hypothetical protein [Anaerofustis stercorihominis]
MKILKVWISILVAVLLILYINNTGILLDLVLSIDKEHYLYSFFDNKEILFLITFPLLITCAVIYSAFADLSEKITKLEEKIDELTKKE